MEAFCQPLTEIQKERINDSVIILKNLTISKCPAYGFQKSRWNIQTIPTRQVVACTGLKSLNSNSII